MVNEMNRKQLETLKEMGGDQSALLTPFATVDELHNDKELSNIVDNKRIKNDNSNNNDDNDNDDDDDEVSMIEDQQISGFVKEHALSPTTSNVLTPMKTPESK